MASEHLAPDRLCRLCAVERFSFRTTSELPDVDGPLGQQRALAALEFGVALRGSGYHIFALGPPGRGKRSLVQRVLGHRAAHDPPPADWCYINDFADPQKPRALKLPAGRAVPLKRDMDRLIEDLGASIPAVFESEDYRTRLQVLEKQLAEKREQAIHAVQQRAEERHVAVVRTPVGLAVAPVRDGEVLDPEQFHKLPEEEQRRIQEDIGVIQEALQAALRTMPQLEREHRERAKDLNREVALFAAGHLVDDLRKQYADLPQVLAHLDAVQADVVENVHDFLGSAEPADVAGQIRKLLAETPALRRYRVNVMVSNETTGGAPIVQEDLPSYTNLFGRIEHHAHFGTLVTDFTLIRSGALHRANGGYLVLDARRLVSHSLSYDQLKRALELQRIRIDTPERIYGYSGTASLEPEPIPLDVKVVLLGDRRLYHLLAAYDPEFLEHFKVAADFEDVIERDGNEEGYARLVARLARSKGLRAFSRGAVAELIENAARIAEDGDRMSSDVAATADLMREADFAAAAAARDTVDRVDVQAAIDAQRRRHGRVRERTLDEIARGTLLIDTAGATVGQVNGLSVLQIGSFAFGFPSRITARVRLGKGEVVDIEREVELGGPIHSKGVLILAGFLASRFAADRPFTLAASLVFEQSYGGVEGDSASCAELYALLSALSGIPIRQGVAVTGSVNQLGQVQPVGGVNDKIEGFFDVCRRRGLDGSHGVLIPAANVKHLMLRRDVVSACAEGAFHVWSLADVDDGIELLTGVPAGVRQADGTFTPGSVQARVAARLSELAEKARAFASPSRTPEAAP